MNMTMGSTRAESILKRLDDLAAFAKVISDPNMLASLKKEFADSAQEIKDATALYEQAQSKATTSIAEANKRNIDVNAREQDIATAQANLDKHIEAHKSNVAILVQEVEKHNANIASAEGNIRKISEEAREKIEHEQTALNERESKLIEREKEVEFQKAEVQAAADHLADGQKKVNDLIDEYNGMISKLKAIIA